MAAVDVVVCGHLCLDLYPQMAHVPLAALSSPGQLFEVGTLKVSTGGAVGNTGLALHKLGSSVRLMSNVGADPIGEMILAYLSSCHASLTQAIKVKPGEKSSYTIVLSPQVVDRIFLHCTGTNTTFGIDDIDLEIATSGKIFHLGYPPLLPRLLENNGESIAELFRFVYQAGVITSLDMTLPDTMGTAGGVDWRELLRRTLSYVDVFVPSIDEILYMLRRDDYLKWKGKCSQHVFMSYLDTLADELFALGRSCIIGFKLGDKGLYLKTTSREHIERLRRLDINVSVWAGQRVWHPAFRVEVAGTTGAGDSAYAGLLTALIHNMPPVEATQMACAVGACNVEQVDGASGIQSWMATQQRIASGWQMLSGELKK